MLPSAYLQSRLVTKPVVALASSRSWPSICRLPDELAHITLDVSDLGRQITHPNGLDVHLVGFFNGSLQLDVAGPRERIDGADEPGRWRASLSVSGRPQSLDIVFAETQEQLDYPFDLTIATE
jgi:hypothetical protein